MKDKPLAIENAHVLFIDVVGYSVLALDKQVQIQEWLKRIVRCTAGYRSTKKRRIVHCLPTGDGMALVIFRDPTVPTLVAVEISKALRAQTGFGIRIGLHSGPVRLVRDINQRVNVAGHGVNLAQRVMDLGDAGHILVSNPVAECLQQMGGWSDYLHELGDFELVTGVRLRLFNLWSEAFGNPASPRRIAGAWDMHELTKAAA
jgi:class 3 adenylate cyclase